MKVNTSQTMTTEEQVTDRSMNGNSQQTGSKQIYYVVGAPLSTPETDPDIYR